MLPSIILIIFLIFIFFLGLEKTLQVLPVLIILGLLFWFLGWFAINFFWIILLIWFVRKLLYKPEKRRRTYYRTYTSTDTEEIFKEFFKQNGFNYQNGSYKQNYDYQQNNNYQNWALNKDKYYEELGVTKNCSKEELRKAYLKKVKENHPDRFSNASDEEKELHENKLKKINEAYDNLIKDFS